MFGFIISLVIAVAVFLGASADQWITGITPFVVFGFSALWQKYIAPSISGWQMLVFVVPVISIVLTAVTAVFQTGTNFWIQFIAGFGAIVLSQFQRQLSPTKVAADSAGK